MLELRHMVPEVGGAESVRVVDLSSDGRAGADMADKVRFWSPGAEVEVVASELSGERDRDLVFIVHEGLLYLRGGRLRRAVKAQLERAPVVATFDLRTQRAWRIDRAGYRSFARRARIYPYLLAVVRRLPAILRRPLLGAR